jgi:putative acetyltransferase
MQAGIHNVEVDRTSRAINEKMTVMIRAEEPQDVEHVRRVHQRAFGRPSEAALVDSLRGSVGTISLVAVIGARVVGHILFTRVQIDGDASSVSAVGLAPLAVLPDCQRQGVGSQLVRAGLDECRKLGENGVVVLGHPKYYRRFGFVPASTKGIEYEHPAPLEAFMVLELQPGALAHTRGVVRYRPAFSSV